jgi:hypothetical protein
LVELRVSHSYISSTKARNFSKDGGLRHADEIRILGTDSTRETLSAVLLNPHGSITAFFCRQTLGLVMMVEYFRDTAWDHAQWADRFSLRFWKESAVECKYPSWGP